ncbi:MAG: Glycosyl transferase [Candidatus Roizmanbacteria bacterium GW2011_GWA2_35_19]|uniref:Glycosyl transferase n=1 Tax=Candidatus Roizmanbacteria bacterium GW2011_GWA2_35_19 TaxID=1618478 RepID=A0A0G0E8V3_9BACT|nr:MAG: Glycosyl transferase [Candidatus Roizmanbacteria bacterium GW2011_GWA2_35_19]
MIAEKNQGIAHARNAGFNIAKGDIFIKVDADTALPRQYIKKVKNIFSTNEIIAYVSDFIFIDVFILKFSRLFSVLFQFFFRVIFGYNVLTGPAFAIRKSVWSKIKDELCVDDDQAHEDIDLSIHISSIGKIYYDQSTAIHISGRRMKFNPLSFFIEYPVIFLKMLGSHRSKLNK